MDPIVYSSAMKGEFDNLAGIIGQLEQEQTLCDNTVLHIAAQYGQTEFVEKLLKKTHPNILSMLLPAKNRKGNTALHVAAREGHLLIIKALITRAKELDDAGPENGLNIVEEILTSENKDGDTALHEALRTFNLKAPCSQGEDDVGSTTKGNDSSGVPTLVRIVTGLGRKESSRAIVEASDLHVVSLLVYPKYAYGPNKAGETPLYLAAEFHSHQVVGMITDKLPSSEESAAGPGGRTAMHAAVISNNRENTAILLEWNKDLAGKEDRRGWTPIHYAAELGLADRVKQLLMKSVTLGYQITGGEGEDGKNTALHLAARGGHMPVIWKLIWGCPGCWDIVNAKGQNMLHVAVESEQPEVIKFYKRRPFLGGLVNQKDNDGNTPLHLAARDYQVLRHFNGTDYSRLDKTSYNNENQSVLDILASSGHGSTKKKEGVTKLLIKDGVPQVYRNSITISTGKQKKAGRAGTNKKKEITKAPDHSAAGQGKHISTTNDTAQEDDFTVEGLAKMLSSQMLVATLVATATFAVGIAMPGGYNGQVGRDQGVALLLRQRAFKGFVATDVLAMIFSTAALLLFLTFRIAYKRRSFMSLHVIFLAMGCSVSSVVLMTLAFITGSFAVLAHLPSLAVAMCVISSMFCVAVFSYLFIAACLVCMIFLVDNDS